MSLAQLFYLKQRMRQAMRRVRTSSSRSASANPPTRRLSRESAFTLEPLEPRLLLSATLDVDLNGQADALTDGVLITRHLFGFTGSTLTNGAVDPNGQRTDPTAIATYLESIRPSLDVDQNGQADALTDGVLITRHLFGFTGTTLTDGAVDPAGQRTDPATITTYLTRLTTTQQADAVLTWHQVMLDAIQQDATAPPVASRGLAMVSLAIYDTLNAIDGTPGYYVSLAAQAGTNPDAAVAAAAHRMLSYLYPGQQAQFDDKLATSLAAIPDGTGKTNALTLGRSIAEAIIAIRASDGWNDFVDHQGGTQAGQWQPTAPMFDVALLPQWADLTPFALSSPDQFRPAGPPALDSAAYTTAFNEVKALGAATGSTRTAEQTEIARFWADGAGSATPPGHWNAIAEQLALQQGNSLSANARMFAQLNVALADAGITAWNTKYHSNFWRPITAIQQAAQDGNGNTAQDANWTALLITPPFPEYVSGHSTYSAAAARILTNLFGNNVGFSTTSQGLPGVTRTFTSLDQAAQEAGRSRIYGGIHFEFSNQDGLTAGRQVADQVLSRFSATTDQQGPTIIVNQPSGTVTKTNLTLTGQVLDNLSGVAALQAKLDGGTFAPITLSPTGTFSLPTTLALNGTGDGLHTVTLQATDNQTNVSSLAFTFTLDTKAPTLTLTSPADNAALTVTTRLTGTADGTGSKLVELSYKFDNGPVVPVSFDHTTGSIDTTLDLSKLGTGTHTLTLRAQDQAGHVTTVTKNVTLQAAIPLTIIEVTPQAGASDVGSTFRPQVSFSRPVNVGTLNANNFYATDSTGAKLAATIVPAKDGTFAWLFLTNPMPGASMITIHVDGTTILAAGDGQALDADGNGTAGGIFTSTFSTVSLVPLQGTTLSGRVVDPGPDLKPMTFDDLRPGNDGILHTDDDVFLNPIAGVKVYILGLENQAVFTDAQGRFSFNAVPSGDIKLAVDGRTATNAPSGVFYPEMVMDLQIEVGQANTVMGTMGSHAERVANLTRPEVYLPRLETSILQNVSNTGNTTIGVDAASAPNLTEQQRAQLQLVVQPGSLVDAKGNSITNGQVGISTVPPELVRDMLPPGVLQHTFDITIQAPGVAAFNTPLQITFPNTFNAAPGTKLNFLSFDHTTGRLVIDGTATVSADGLSVTSDPGQGITKPGWHGLSIAGIVSRLLGLAGIHLEPPCIDAALGAASLVVPAFKGGKLLSKIGEAVDVLSAVDDGLKLAGSFNTGVFSHVADKYFEELGAVAQDITSGINIYRVSPDKFLDSTVKQALAGQKRLVIAQAGLLGARGIFKVLDIGELIENVKKCRESLASVHNAIPNNASLAVTEADPVSTLINFEASLINTLQPLADAMQLMIGDSIDRLVGSSPSIRVLSFENGNVSVRDVDGHQLSDPNTGLSLRFKTADLLDSRLTTDQEFQRKVSALFLKAFDAANGNGDPTKGLAVLADKAADSLSTFVDTLFPPADSLTVEKDTWISVTSQSSGQIIFRSKVSADGSVSPFLSADDSYLVEAYSPSKHLYGIATMGGFVSGASVDNKFFLSRIPGIPLFDDLNSDADGDGLSDRGEYVLGTNPNRFATAGDGISDSVKLELGLDPLSGRALPTGVVSSTALQGEAKAVVLEGSPNNAETQTAYVATGSYGLAIVDASQFQKPLVLGQLDLPGDAVDVSVDSSLGIAAVASGTGGLHLVNVSTPTALTLLRTIAVNASQVEVFEGIAYVGVGSEIQAYDLLTGEKLSSSVGAANFTGLAREGSMLYAMDNGRVLRAIEIGTDGMIAKGTLTMPSAGSKLFVGNGIAYVAAGTGSIGGFMTANVSNPDLLTLISGIDAANVEGQALAVNGSGLAVSVGRFSGPGGQPIRQVHVLDVRDPANTAGFVTAFDLSADPFDVAIGAGIAFVADGTGGLQVVNYRSFDNQGLAPTVTAVLDAVDINPTVPGVQVQEGSTVGLRPTVTDDVQVRNVELLVNGQVVKNDVAFPFEMRTALPTIAANGSNQVTLQVRATDTGRNVGLSTPITIQLVPDTFAPTIAGLTPVDGSRHGQAFRTVTVSFSEAMDISTLTAANIQLIGPNGAVTPANIQMRSGDRMVQLTYDPLVAGNYQVVINQAGVKDRAGNAVGAETTTSQFTNLLATAVFNNSTGNGFWDVAENWDGGVLPTATDDVLLNAPDGHEVIFRTGTATIRSLTSTTPFTLSGGTLTVEQTVQVNNTFKLAGGTLKDARVLAGSSGEVTVQFVSFLGSPRPSRLDGVTLETNLGVVAAARLIVSNGLTLNGTLTLGSAGSSTGALVDFEGAGLQTLGGTGRVVFGGTGSNNQIRPITTGGTLVIGPRMVIEGGTGGGFVGDGTLGLRLEGQVRTAGRTITLAGNWTTVGTSAGTIDVTGGGTLNLGGTFTTADLDPLRLKRNATSTLVLTGTLTNTNQTLTLETGPTWQLGAGKIVGGTVTGSGELTVLFVNFLGSPVASRLDGVTLETNVGVAAGARLIVSNGLTLNGTLTLGSAGSSSGTLVDFEGAGLQTFGGTGRVVFGGTGSNHQIRPLTTGGTLVIGPGIEVEGWTGGGTIGDGTLGLQIQGQVRTAGRTLTLTGNWTTGGTTPGTIDVTSGGTLNLSGTFTTADLDPVRLKRNATSTVVLTGTLTNTNQTLTLETGPTWQLGAGKIVGGTVTGSGELTVLFVNFLGSPVASRLDGVTLERDLNVAAGARLIVTNGLTLNGTLTLGSAGSSSGALVDFEGAGTQTLGGTGRVVFGGPGGSNQVRPITAGGTLLIGPGIVVEGGTGGGTVGDGTLGLQIQGQVRTAGRTITLRGTSIINNGMLNGNNQGGVLTVVGALSNNGIISVVPGALLSVTGNYAQGASGNLRTEVGGLLTNQLGRVTVTGSATLDGTLNVALANGFTPVANDRFRFMTFASRSGFFATQTGLDLGGGLAFQVDQTDPLDLELVTVGTTLTSTIASVADSASRSLASAQPAWLKDFVAGDLETGKEDVLVVMLPK